MHLEWFQKGKENFYLRVCSSCYTLTATYTGGSLQDFVMIQESETAPALVLDEAGLKLKHF